MVFDDWFEMFSGDRIDLLECEIGYCSWASINIVIPTPCLNSLNVGAHYCGDVYVAWRCSALETRVRALSRLWEAPITVARSPGLSAFTLLVAVLLLLELLLLLSMESGRDSTGLFRIPWTSAQVFFVEEVGGLVEWIMFFTISIRS